MRIFDKSLRGVYVPHRKNTQAAPTEIMPVPPMVAITVSQYLGPQCNILVKKNDTVFVGQKIGDTNDFLTVPVHSGVSGTVKRIEQVLMPNGAREQTVFIETDGLQTLHPDIKPPFVTDRKGFVQAVRDCGLVGLGGAGFPTHVKLNTKSNVDVLLINAAECEPYITSDHRTMLEDGRDVIAGICLVMKHLQIDKCLIGIEDNKPDAIKEMKRLSADNPHIEVKALASRYPQGAEKVLIYEATGRTMPEGKLPVDVGALVMNVTTISVIAQYFRNGMPLINKRITVDGDAVTTPKNVMVPIGTPISDILNFCGGAKKEIAKILTGGPLMGSAVCDKDFPILKNSNAVLYFSKDIAATPEESACIRCGRCIRACPINLMPLRIEEAFVRDELDELKKYKVNLCIECGCCAYVCPARRQLVLTNRLSKNRLRTAASKAKGAEANE